MKKTRRELFLERMDALIPRQRFEKRIRHYCPKTPKGRGRRRYPLAVMLPMHCVQMQARKERFLDELYP